MGERSVSSYVLRNGEGATPVTLQLLRIHSKTKSLLFLLKGLILPGGGEGDRQAEGQEGFVRDQEPAEGRSHPADDPPPQHHSATGHPGDGEQLLPRDGTVPRWEPHESHL